MLAEETVVYVEASKLAAHEYPGGKEGSHVAAADWVACMSYDVTYDVTLCFNINLCSSTESGMSVSSDHTEDEFDGPCTTSCDSLFHLSGGMP